MLVKNPWEEYRPVTLELLRDISTLRSYLNLLEGTSLSMNIGRTKGVTNSIILSLFAHLGKTRSIASKIV